MSADSIQFLFAWLFPTVCWLSTVALTYTMMSLLNHWMYTQLKRALKRERALGEVLAAVIRDQPDAKLTYQFGSRTIVIRKKDGLCTVDKTEE